MVAKGHLKYGKIVSDSLQDKEGINTPDEDHVESKFFFKLSPLICAGF
jgi:hypothetical protein